MDAYGFLGFITILILGAIYFFPVFLASSRNHPNTGAIFTLTLLLGWTFVGWAVAVIWAMTNTAAQQKLETSGQ